jgi:hypothetical protein
MGDCKDVINRESNLLMRAFLEADSRVENVCISSHALDASWTFGRPVDQKVSWIR